MTDFIRALMERLEANARESTAQLCAVVDIGPFRAFLHPTQDLPWFSYVMPVAALDDPGAVAAALATLRSLFASRKRVLRFEFSDALWPTLPALLEAAGLELEASQPAMLCTPSDFRPFSAPDVQVEILGPDSPFEVLAAYRALRRQALHGHPYAPTPEEIDRFREHLRTTDERPALARLAGAHAGVARTARVEEIGELEGVYTLPDRRRRGVAATASSTLVQDFFARGGALVWLNAEEHAWGVYERIGFRHVAIWLNYTDPSPLPPDPLS
jgi:ribosomal protein S18 acetylase RimI-like enzyme